MHPTGTSLSVGSGQEAVHAPCQGERSRHKRWLLGSLTLVAAGLAILIRLPLLERPLDRDEGLYAYMAQQIEAGFIPYRDVFSDKPPVGFVLYWAFLRLFGPTTAGIHLGGALWAALGAVLLALVAGRFVPPGAAGASALFWSVSCAQASVQGSSINLELLATPWALAGLLAASPQPSLAFLSGIFLGLAWMTKQTAIGHVAMGGLLVAVGLAEGRKDMGRRVQGLLAYGAGLGLSLGVILLLLWALGAPEEFLEQALLYNLTAYVQREPLARAPRNFAVAVSGLFFGNPALYLLALWGAWLAPSCAWPKARALLIAWFTLNFAAVAVGFRFYPHYFVLILPPICVLAARRVGSCAGAKSSWKRRTLALVGAVVPLAAPLLLEKQYFFNNNACQHVKRLYGDELFCLSNLVALEVQRLSAPDEPMFILGSEPQIYFLARRRSAVPYAFIHPLTVASPRAAALQKRVADALESQAPLLLLIVFVPMSHMYEEGASDHLEQRIGHLCRRQYRLAAVFGDENFVPQLQRYHPPVPPPWQSLLRGRKAALFVRQDFFSSGRPPSEFLHPDR
jgi:4-amino-4-deoxy-L-arabinose transferase-like glycosyltransferase